MPESRDDHTETDDRREEPAGDDRARGGSDAEASAAPEEPTHEGTPRDRGSEEPLGPATPDAERPLGDTAEAHGDITPHDLPKGHPGRAEAEREAAESGTGTTSGNR